MSIEELLTATENNAELVELILCDRYFGLNQAGSERMQQLMQEPGAAEAFVLCEYYLDTKQLSAEETEHELVLLKEQLQEKGIPLTLLLALPSAESEATPVKRIAFGRLRKYWVAAGFAAAVITGIFLYVKNEGSTDKTGQPISKLTQDVPPGKDRAVLTLADGSTIVLDDQEKGNIAQEGGTNVIKLNNGLLSYEASSGSAAGAASQPAAYNTITTPRAGKYSIELPDGSKVWLNAASSLHFPVAFTGSERMVELSGEAYFEVAANARKPFMVKAGPHIVNVIGTHFNISAYTEDPVISTTLLEGSVRVTNGEVAQYLDPGQQAQSNRTNNKIQLVRNPDLEEVMAWKNGIFYLNGSSLDHLMKQISRWYDMEVEYVNVDKSAGRFMGTIPRDVPLSQVLHLLELTGNTKFTIQGKHILVSL